MSMNFQQTVLVCYVYNQFVCRVHATFVVFCPSVTHFSVFN